MRVLAVVLAVVLVSVSSLSAQAADLAELDAEIERACAPLVARDGRHGVVVGIFRGDDHHFVSSGRPSKESERPLAPDSLFEIGSITKTFTGTLLALRVAEGAVTLDQPVQTLLPDGVTVPALDDRAITLRDLATHRSGLPRLPSNLRPETIFDPYAGYTAERLYAFLGEHELRRTPGAEYEYSNLGMGLLGHALALDAGEDYGELVRRRLCEPLGMDDTVFTVDDERETRMTRGHLQNGLPTSRWDLAVLVGAGGAVSSARDLLRWAKAAASPGDDAVGHAIETALEPRAEVPGNGKIGLGWHLPVVAGEPLAVHEGATGGYNAFVGVRRERRLGVVVLTNRARSGDVTAGSIGLQVLALLEGRRGDDGH